MIRVYIMFDSFAGGVFPLHLGVMLVHTCEMAGRPSEFKLGKHWLNAAYRILHSMVGAYCTNAGLSHSKADVLWGTLLRKQIPRQAKEVLQGHTQGGT